MVVLVVDFNQYKCLIKSPRKLFFINSHLGSTHGFLYEIAFYQMHIEKDMLLRGLTEWLIGNRKKYFFLRKICVTYDYLARCHKIYVHVYG